MLWIIIAALAVISILVVYSSTAKMAYDAHTERTTYHFLRQQVMVLILSLGVMIAVQKINCRVYRTLAQPAYIASVLLTLLAYFIGRTTNGAARWIPLGFFDLQPSEALKVATVLFLARQLGSRQSRIDKIRIVPSLKFWTWRRSREQRRIWREGTWPILMPVAVSAVVIFPAHTSSAVLVCMASWVMMLIGRVNIRELMKLVGLGIAAILLVWTLNLGRSETAEGRVGTWLHLWTTSQTDKPIEHLSDTERSMIAIHNGGLLGEGAGQSAMRVEMIHPESDYAYAFFVEEYGLLLAVVLLPALIVNDVGMGDPYFCKYICPQGVLEGAIPLAAANESIRAALGALFTRKLIILIAVVVLSVLFFRPFCKWICPLGAFYALMNKVSLLGIQVDTSKCVSCGKCERTKCIIAPPADLCSQKQQEHENRASHGNAPSSHPAVSVHHSCRCKGSHAKRQSRFL